MYKLWTINTVHFYRAPLICFLWTLNQNQWQLKAKNQSILTYMSYIVKILVSLNRETDNLPRVDNHTKHFWCTTSACNISKTVVLYKLLTKNCSQHQTRIYLCLSTPYKYLQLTDEDVVHLKYLVWFIRRVRN